MTSVLMVCLGNICRSPLAEAAMRDAATKAGKDVKVDSAGTAAYHIGKAPDPRSQEIAMEYAQIDISHYKARQVQASDFDKFDYIFAMDDQNYRDLLAVRPDGSPAELALLCVNGVSVADPYYGNIQDFKDVWQQVSNACNMIVRNL